MLLHQDVATRANDEGDLAISVLRKQADRAASCIAGQQQSLEGFIGEDGIRTVIRGSERLAPPAGSTAPDVEDPIGAGDSTSPSERTRDRTNNATATAFALSRVVADHQSLAGQVLTRASKFDPLWRTAINDFQALYGASAPSEQNKETVEHFPNTYHTPIHLSALASVIGIAPQNDEKTEQVVSIGDQLAGALADWFVLNVRIAGLSPDNENPFDPRMAVETVIDRVAHGQTNAYLTFLTVSAISRWMQARNNIEPDILSRVNKGLAVALAVATNDLSRHVASFSADLESLYDAVEVVCNLSIVGSLSVMLGKVDEYTRAITAAAVQLVIDNFLLKDGSFAPKPAAFTTRDNRSVVVSTAELADILMEGVGRSLNAGQLAAFSPIVDGVIRKSKGMRGWGAESAGSESRKPSFVTAASLSFLARYVDASRQAIAQSAARELQARPYVPNDFLDQYDFPSAIKDRLIQHVIRPLREPGLRHLAAMSLVLEGPPGTSKTTIARKIAYELRWPLVVLEQGSFLREGAAQVEAEAERIFELLNQLSDTVVLLDEIEEMVGDRGFPGNEQSSRFLTTSMLPRIHTLRDAGRIIFIIATNHEDRLDPAAVRPGRVDQIFTVDPPTHDERASILSNFVERLGAPERVAAFVLSKDCLDKTDKFTVGYLREVVRTLVLEADSCENEIAMLKKVEEIGVRVTKEQVRSDGNASDHASTRRSGGQ